MESITRFERARIISARALQLALGAPVLIKSKNTTDPRLTAKAELAKGVLPLAVLRQYPNGDIKRIELS